MQTVYHMWAASWGTQYTARSNLQSVSDPTPLEPLTDTWSVKSIKKHLLYVSPCLVHRSIFDWEGTFCSRLYPANNHGVMAVDHRAGPLITSVTTTPTFHVKGFLYSAQAKRNWEQCVSSQVWNKILNLQPGTCSITWGCSALNWVFFLYIHKGSTKITHRTTEWIKYS